MTRDLTGHVAVVTGGARRLGKSIALALAHAGCHVVITYRTSASEARDTVEAACGAGVRALAVEADVAQSADVARLLDSTLEAFGRADILVASVGAFRRTPLATLTETDWDDMITSNLRTAFLCTHRFGLHMRAHGGGAMVTLADVAAFRPWGDYLPYSIAKAGVVTLTQALAKELAPSVRVNAIAPGPVLFPEGYDPVLKQREIGRTLLQREGHPSNVADAVLALVCNDYITGVVLPVDGGRLLS
jgi:NAD(P)-dependent dehydrogenase (short-subunit alcohol dehydrogenase family)